MAMTALLGALTWKRVVGCCVLFLVVGFLVDLVALPRYPDQIPAFGHGRGVWAHLRNSVAYFSSQRAWIREGYAKYGKRGVPFIVPASISRPCDMVLPQSMVA